MDSKFDKEITSTFKAETREHLEEIENGILKLENSTLKQDYLLIQAMFRSAHSIKAGANLLEFKRIEKIAHVLENQLQKMLNGECRLDSEFATAFLQRIDQIRELVDNLQLNRLF